MRNWESLYTRQPLHLDVLLLAIALALHAPLLKLEIKAPPKASKGKISRLHNIDFLEQQTKKRQEKPVALPPKIISKPKDIQKIVKKPEDIIKELMKKSPPPPPPMPKAKLQENLLKPPEPSKIDAKRLDPQEQQKRLLQGKDGFKKELNLSNPQANNNIKLGGGAASQINAGSRSDIPMPQGGKLSGKSGFAVSSKDLPAGIGGDSGLKIGGAENVVVVPVGKRAMGDANIMSPTIQDKGSLQTSAPATQVASAKGSGLAVGGGGSSSIALGGGRGAVSAPAAPSKVSKTFNAPAPSAASDNMGAIPAAPALSSIPRRTVARAAKPMFLITGPLQNRKILFQQKPPPADENGSVLLQFTVSPEGHVKDNILVVRTSGNPRMDEMAVQALRAWKFAPLPTDQWRDETGTITFNFEVR